MDAQSSAPISFVTKARTAFQSAAAKAERVFTDIKSDFSDRIDKQPTIDSDKQLQQQSSYSHEVKEKFFNLEGEVQVNFEDKHTKWNPAKLVSKKDWHEKFRNLRIGKKGQENSNIDNTEGSTMSVPYYDENLYLLNMKNDAEAKVWQLSSIIEKLNSIHPDAIPSTSVIRQLAVAIDSAKKYKSMKDLVACSSRTSPKREKSTLSIAAVKSLVIRDKEEKLASEHGDEERVLWLINSLFDGEDKFLRRNIPTGVQSIYRDIHGAPPESLLVKLSEVIGSFKTLRKMALLWYKVVDQLRRLWIDEVYIPGIPLYAGPDLNTCLVYQQFEVLNCCLSRKRRRLFASESLESIMNDASLDCDELAPSMHSNQAARHLYARINSGELVLRLGTNHLIENLTMLDTGEPIYAPITQEGPLLTEDLIKETEEFVLRTGSVGAGCSQLLSDMQAFKAANPGCILEDFVRWHSPPDWSESEVPDEPKESVTRSESSLSRGCLSGRMQREGNLWRELWETSKPVPAIKQAPLYDEDLAVEGILDDFYDIHPSTLFEQLYISLLGLGFVMAEAKLIHSNDFAKLYYECKDYVTVVCQGNLWTEKLDDLCQVYETVESMITNPEEVLRKLKLAENISTNGEQKRRFKILGLTFGIKERNFKKSPTTMEAKDSKESKTYQAFSSFSENKSSLFSKKPPKPNNADSYVAQDLDDGDWAIV